MKMIKKTFCVLLSLLLCFSAVSIAFAADEPLNYVILGDSIGWGAGVLNSDEAVFGKIVADTNGYNFKNDAVNGYRTGDLLNHLEKANIAEDVKNADIISVSIGGNNFLRGNMKDLIARIKAVFTGFGKAA